MYWEIKKILSRKSVWGMFGILMIYAIYLFASEINGYNEHAVTEHGDVIVGKEAILLNQEAAEKYKGSITEAKLEELRKDYENSPVGISEYGWEVRNTTLDFFERMFWLSSSPRSLPDAYPQVEKAEMIQYGYADVWQGIFMKISDIMLLFPFVLILAFAPVISFDNQCGVHPLILTSKNGGKKRIKEKMWACFLLANMAFLLVMAVLCGGFLSRYGLCGYDTSIQCGFWYTFYDSDCMVTYGYLLIHTLFLDWAVINVIVLIILLISKKTPNPFASMGIAFAVMYLGNIEVVHNIVSNPFLERIVSLLPINALNILQVARIPTIKWGDTSVYWFYILEIAYAAALVFFYACLVCAERGSGPTNAQRENLK